MWIFTLRRLNLFIFTMLLLSILSFSLSFLFPGEQIVNISGQLNASDTQLVVLNQSYQSDDNIVSRYFAYVGHIINGDIGMSMATQQRIAYEIQYLVPATIELSLFAFFIATLIGVPLGFLAAINHKKVIDNIILGIAMVGYSVPVFWLGLLAILTFSIQLGWLPSSGKISLLYEIPQVTGFLLIDIFLSDNEYKWQAVQNSFAHMILPATVIAIAQQRFLYVLHVPLCFRY